MDAMQIPAGWYPETGDPTHLRFWTGTAWSAHRKPRPGLDRVVIARARSARIASRRAG